MKPILKSTSLLFLILAFSLSGCQKDKSTKELLIGKWEVKSMESVTYENGVKTNDDTQTLGSKAMEIEIKADGTGNEYENQVVNDAFTWTLNGNKITVSISGQADMVLTVTVNEDNLTLKSSETTIDGQITYKSDMTIKATRE